MHHPLPPIFRRGFHLTGVRRSPGISVIHSTQAAQASLQSFEQQQGRMLSDAPFSWRPSIDVESFRMLCMIALGNRTIIRQACNVSCPKHAPSEAQRA